MGAAVDERIYRQMGHTVNRDELEAVRAMLSPPAA
jgi:predicted esterase